MTSIGSDNSTLLRVEHVFVNPLQFMTRTVLRIGLPLIKVTGDICLHINSVKGFLHDKLETKLKIKNK